MRAADAGGFIVLVQCLGGEFVSVLFVVGAIGKDVVIVTYFISGAIEMGHDLAADGEDLETLTGFWVLLLLDEAALLFTGFGFLEFLDLGELLPTVVG